MLRCMVGERLEVRETRAMGIKKSRRQSGGHGTDRRRSGIRGRMEISKKWISLASGSGVQSLGIDLFKIQNSALDKLSVPKSPSKPTRERGEPLSHSKNQSWVKSVKL